MYSTSEVQHVPDKQRCLLWNIYTLVKVKFIMKHYTQDRNLTVKIYLSKCQLNSSIDLITLNTRKISTEEQEGFDEKTEVRDFCPINQ